MWRGDIMTEVNDWASPEIEKKLKKILDNDFKAPEDFKSTTNVKDNNYARYEIYPADANTWNEVKKVIITEDISETRIYTYRRKDLNEKVNTRAS